MKWGEHVPGRYLCIPVGQIWANLVVTALCAYLTNSKVRGYMTIHIETDLHVNILKHKIDTLFLNNDYKHRHVQQRNQ